MSEMYLLDNNVLGMLGKLRRESTFFRAHCRIPAEVAHEARRVAYAKSLDAISVPVTPEILDMLTEVMKAIPVGSTDMVNLYDNKGAADPVLVATALALNHPRVPTLFDERWVVVTNDKAVHATAKQFKVETLLPGQLAQVIDQALATGQTSRS